MFHQWRRIATFALRIALFDFGQMLSVRLTLRLRLNAAQGSTKAEGKANEGENQGRISGHGLGPSLCEFHARAGRG
jgi:hypothetical protein